MLPNIILTRDMTGRLGHTFLDIFFGMRIDPTTRCLRELTPPKLTEFFRRPGGMSSILKVYIFT